MAPADDNGQNQPTISAEAIAALTDAELMAQIESRREGGPNDNGANDPTFDALLDERDTRQGRVEPGTPAANVFKIKHATPAKPTPQAEPTSILDILRKAAEAGDKAAIAAMAAYNAETSAAETKARIDGLCKTIADAVKLAIAGGVTSADVLAAVTLGGATIGKTLLGGATRHAKSNISVAVGDTAGSANTEFYHVRFGDNWLGPKGNLETAPYELGARLALSAAIYHRLGLVNDNVTTIEAASTNWLGTKIANTGKYVVAQKHKDVLTGLGYDLIVSRTFTTDTAAQS